MFIDVILQGSFFYFAFEVSDFNIFLDLRDIHGDRF